MVVKGKQRIRSSNRKHSTSSLSHMLRIDQADSDYKNHLFHEFDENLRPESSGKRMERDSQHDYDDDDEEEKDDPELMFFLDGLKVDDKWYRFEHVVNDRRHVIIYEGASISDKESDEEQRKQLKSAMKQKDGPVIRIPHLENLDLHHTLARKGDLSLDEVSDREHRRTRSGAKQNKDMKTLTSRGPRKKKDDDIVSIDRDYHYFLKHQKVVNDHTEFNDGTHKVEYERRTMGKLIQVKEEREDVSYSDVEIIDTTTTTAFYRMDKSSNSKKDTTEQSEFKRRVIAALRKPFDREEYEKLRRDIKRRTAKERHLDLRNGREKPIGTQEYGKSYLDYHPDLKKMFQQAKDDKPKRLNLLRGFFLWIEDDEHSKICIQKLISRRCAKSLPLRVVLCRRFLEQAESGKQADFELFQKLQCMQKSRMMIRMISSFPGRTKNA